MSMHRVNVTLDRVDFEELRQQKLELLKLIWDQRDHPVWGIVELIDAVQDQAVGQNGLTEFDVFGDMTEDES